MPLELEASGRVCLWVSNELETWVQGICLSYPIIFAILHASKYTRDILTLKVFTLELLELR